MAKYLATYNDTLNEIEINGFTIMTDKEIEKYEELANSISWDFVYKIGEEELQFSSGEDLLTRIDYKEISNDEYKVLKKIFKGEFGIFITEDFLIEIAGEEYDDEEDDETDDSDYLRYDDDSDDEY